MPNSETQSLTVSQALSLAKGALDKISATIIGEVSEVSDKPGYKAVYFTIRDESSALPCLIWKNNYNKLGLSIKAGMLVEIRGRFSLYAAKGRMNFTAYSISLAGEGELRMRVAQLARKLEAEGLMDPGRKRALPSMPMHIAVVTSPRGKAVHDVLRTLRRRFPLAEVLICGVPVEGAGAPDAMIEGLHAAEESSAELVLLVRGGGSYEDLMPFNDERLARAVCACTIPVVTGIGHEPDNSIVDMVADFRASTPTAAAEHVVPQITEMMSNLSDDALSLANSRATRVRELDMWIDQTSKRLHSAIPRAIENDMARVTGLRERLYAAGCGLAAYDVARINALGERMCLAGASATQRHSNKIASLHEHMLARARALLDPYAAHMGKLAAELDGLSPLAVLARGYSVTYDASGGIVSSVDAVNLNDEVLVSVSDGDIRCTVHDKHKHVENSDGVYTWKDTND
ncbi:MAG: exodeoxyribonuclease VII large subunit [Coriobacteriales bacterium]|jgi:exodeoxyribonuclease VII large subunit|nr:exodeoxyribonuclease VII large subunit [Coriobacteriales bacterium]